VWKDRGSCVEPGRDGEDGLVKGRDLKGGDVNGPGVVSESAKDGIVEGMDGEP